MGMTAVARGQRMRRTQPGTSRSLARDGAVLIEVIIAMSILFLSGLVSVHLTLEARTAVERATLREAELLAASQFMSVVWLWPREDLDRRLGVRAQGGWLLRIERAEPSLYSITILDGLTQRPLVSSVRYVTEPPLSHAN
jgi:hypothetical protein